MSSPSTLPVVTDPINTNTNGSSRPESHATTSSTKLSSNEIEGLREQRKQKTNFFRQAITQTPDFPQPGILFEDIFPIFTSPPHHEALIEAYELQIKELQGGPPDVIVGLDARGFLIGPTLALRARCKFVPVRKAGKLPGKLETVTYEKEYGADTFAMQTDSIKPGDKVLVVDDLIATGGSAAAAGQLVKKCGGQLLAYIFIIELTALSGRGKLGDVPVYTLIESQA
ncbi:adenine phosphoribosyltransferase [Lithohypha guttulata]|uniref:adenine phosphoribosyltransferase n=1 Tax=Lithohypha guttulata TaxID=1690604 RepID=A0AAN7YIT5_9EURO|nr:adenine phosphoribosyltransferase [Lithohypha guttulata]KAK5089071.1 adenine phosphoribosyltransferase [Lithohypha guttulata]KAK5106405.1 adenine phosphoribosyltransferase [Lithohypha guttulata]